MVLGATELTLVPDGEMLRPSGEGVYGVPAEDGWGDYTAPDDEGDIGVMPHSLLIRDRPARREGAACPSTDTVLIDTGGENPDEAPGRKSDFLERLAGLGVRPEDVGTVVLTHAHLDHIGYNTRCVRGKRLPTFPNATYWIQEAEAEAFRAEDPERWQRYFGPVDEAHRLRRMKGDLRITPRLTCLATPGHTVGHQSVLIECGPGEGPCLPPGTAHISPSAPSSSAPAPCASAGLPNWHAIYVGDLFVTKLHLEHPDWHPAWCSSTAEERRSKERVVRLALELDAVLIFGHDPDLAWGRVVKERRAQRGRPEGRAGGVKVVPAGQAPPESAPR